MSSNLGVWNSGVHDRKDTLVQKLGGEKCLREAVDRFYVCLLQDPELAPFFRHTDMNILKWHQFNLFGVAFGKHDDFDVSSLILQRHARLFDEGLTLHHLDAFIAHFARVLSDMKVRDDIALEAVDVLRQLRPVFKKGQEEAEKRRRKERNKLLLFYVISATVGAVLLDRLFLKKRL